MTTTTRTSTDDLANAIAWLGSYETDDQNDEMLQSLRNVAEYLARDISNRHAAELERAFKSDIKRDGKMLTEAGKAALKRLTREKGDAYAEQILEDAGNESIGTFR